MIGEMMKFKFLAISLRLLSFLAMMTFGSMAFAVEPVHPDPPVSISKSFEGIDYGYTLEVTGAPEAAGTAMVHDNKIYVEKDKEYTFKLAVTEDSNWYIGIQPTQDDGINLDYDKRNGSRDGAGPNTTYIYITKTFDTPGTKVIANALYYLGADYTGDMTYVPIEVYIIGIDILKVPDYLFAAAKYWTPIKFKVLPDTLAVTAASFTSLKATLHFADESGIEITGLESYVEAVEGEENTFECYIDPANYAAINIADKHYSDNAYFTLEAVLNLDVGTVTCTTDETDAEAKIAEKFVDKAFYAYDMTDGTSPTTITYANDSRPFIRSDAKKRWRAVKFPEHWGEDQAPYSTVGGVSYYSTYIAPGESAEQDGTTAGYPYWDAPKQPKYHYLTVLGLIVNEYTTECYAVADLASSPNWQSTLASNGNPALSVAVKSKQRMDDIDRGTYVGDSAGLRAGGYFFISYGPKSPVCLAQVGAKAMDLSKTQAQGKLLAFTGVAEVYAKGPNGVDSSLLGPTLNVGWALGNTTWAPIFGVLSAIYGYVCPSLPVSDEGKAFARAKYWEIFCKDGDTDAQFVGGGDMLPCASSTETSSPGVLTFDERTVGATYGISTIPGVQHVGTMVGAFVELSARAKLVAKDTNGPFFVDDSSASAKFGTLATDYNSLEIDCVHLP